LFASKPAVKAFFESLDWLRHLEDSGNLLDVLKQTLKVSGYEAFLRDGSEEGENRWENVQELFNVAGSFRKLPWREGLVKFLEEVALMTSADEVDLDSPSITLMTLHQAKGLEFDCVFLVGFEEGILPHSRSLLEPKEIAEEIRLAYVGVTRARKKLYLVYARSRKTYGQRNLTAPSRILKAIPEELLEIKNTLWAA
jgi:DNA helicase-2/ATP-dependent DNA helicase PcrA